MTYTAITGFYDALAASDLDAARACFTDDALVWHSFDGIAQDMATAQDGWAKLIAHSAGRDLHDIRRLPTPGGLVQQHVFVLTLANGTRMAWPVCLVVTLRDGLIARFDEYMDRAGSFTPGQAPIVTPGFPATTE